MNQRYIENGNYAFCKVSISPVRKEPNDKSEMVNQLLFGEFCEVIGENKNWVQVLLHWDGYTGWVDKYQLARLTTAQYDHYLHHSSYCNEIIKYVLINGNRFPLLLGSTLHNYKNSVFQFNTEIIAYNGSVSSQDSLVDFRKKVKQVALKYVNTPYLWGGRSPFGIDCSGLVQCIMKIFGIQIPRDAYLQVNEGDIIDSLDEAQIGDLVFFKNSSKKIHHVGMIIGNGLILHASSIVRVEKIDQLGIFNAEQSTYTHHLYVIKRLVK